MAETIKKLPPFIPIGELHLYGGPKKTKAYALVKAGYLQVVRTAWGTLVTAESFLEYLDTVKYLEGLEDVL
jgi:hypothetical protein